RAAARAGRLSGFSAPTILTRILWKARLRRQYGVSTSSVLGDDRVRMKDGVLRQAAAAVPGVLLVIPRQAAGVIERPAAAVLELHAGLETGLQAAGLRGRQRQRAGECNTGGDDQRVNPNHRRPPSAKSLA